MTDVWMKLPNNCGSETRPTDVPSRSLLELLRAHHEFADDFRNHVATNERYWIEVDGEISGPCRRWYWDSDLRRQTIAALASGQRD